MTLRGRCLCGDIRYEIGSVPSSMGVCHCRDCQRQGGSAFSTMAAVPTSDLTFIRGEPTVYRGGATASGDTAEVAFCGRCGSPIYTVLASQPELVYVKTGTLEDTDWFRPQFHVWCEHKQDWLEIAQNGGALLETDR